MEKKQVKSTRFGMWLDVENESDIFIQAKDVDGVMLYVIKDGTQQTRMVDT